MENEPFKTENNHHDDSERRGRSKDIPDSEMSAQKFIKRKNAIDFPPFKLAAFLLYMKVIHFL